MPLSQLLLVAIVGWALAEHRADTSAARLRPSSMRPMGRASAGLLVVVVAAWGSIGYGILPEVTSLEERQAEHVKRTEAELVHPHFWQQGFIEP